MSQLPIGEIIEVSTTSFVAQCLESPRADQPRLFDPPPFGSFVKIEPRSSTPPLTLVETSSDEVDPFVTKLRPSRDVTLGPDTTFALVCHAKMTSLTAGRRPVALGFEDEDDMLRNQPQLFELLTTEFSGMLVAYTGKDGRVRRHLPPVPPRIHSRVTECTDDEIEKLTADPSFLRSVISPMGTSVCEASPEVLAAASLRAAWNARGQDDEYLLHAGRTLLMLLGDDYDRLQAIMNGVLS